MLAYFTMAQAASPQAVIAQVGMPMLIVSIIIGAAIAGLIIGLLLKFVGGSVLGYPVKYGSSFLAIFIDVLVSSAIGLALVFGGIVTIPDVDPNGGFMQQLMPQGPLVFLVNQAIGFAILTWAIRTFLKGPSDEQPSWGNAAMISVVMTVILIAFAFLLAQLGAGMQQ